MDSESKDIFKRYKKVINEAATPGQGTPFAKQPQKQPVNKIQNKASQLKTKTANVAQQAEEPEVTSDELVAQAEPLVAAANKEVATVAKTSLGSIPRFGDQELISWKDTEFPEMSIRQVQEQAEAAYDLKESFLLIGDPGVGKSSIFKQVGRRIAEEKGKEFIEFFDLNDNERDVLIQNPEPYFVYVDLRLAEMDRSDVVGVPVKSDKPYTVYSPPSWAYALTRPGADGFLFLDEFNQGSKEVKDAAFKIVLDRVLGDRRMSKDVGVVAACNMGELFGNEPISPANINRFGAGVLVVNPDEWRSYAVNASIDDSIIAFTKAIPEDALYKEPKGENPFVTPRVLEKISKGIEYFRQKYEESKAAGRPYDAHSKIKLYAAQRAGIPWANRFDTFLKHMQSFDINKILKDPKKNLKDQPLDKVYALVVFVVDKLKEASSNAKASNGNISPQDREIMTGLAAIMNHLSPEANCVMFEYLNSYVPKDILGFLLDFVVEEDFDPAVKKQFLNEVLPQVKEIIAGGGCKVKR